MRRRALIAASAAGVVSAAASGLSGAAALASPRPAASRSELTLWTMQLSPFHDDYMHGLLQAFERRHPTVRVRWVDVPWAEMERKALASMAAGTAPDVLNLNPQFAARLAELGALRDPAPVLGRDRIEAYLPAAWRANQMNGVAFALPWYLSTTLSVRNREALERAGAAPPQDFSGLLAAAGGGERAPGAPYLWFPALDGSAPLELAVALHGSLFAPDGCSLSQPGSDRPDLLAFLRGCAVRSVLPPAVLTEGHRGAVARFTAGEVAMIDTGMQFLLHIRKNAPRRYAQLEVAPQLAVASATPDSQAPNIAAMNLAVPRLSREPTLAFELAAHITDAHHQTALVKRVPLLPSSRASYADPLFTEPSGDELLDRARAISARQVAQGQVQVPPMRHYQKLRASFVRGLHATIAGRQTPQQAREGINAAWRPLRGCAA